MNPPHRRRFDNAFAERSPRRTRISGEAGRRPASESGEAWTDGTVRTLFLRGRERGQADRAEGPPKQGRALDDFGRPSEALPVFKGALALPEDRRSASDIEALLRHAGRCASDLGDGQGAWEAYLSAALMIPGDDPEGLVDALSEAGLLRVTLLSAFPMEASVDEALVRSAFDGAIQVARRCLLREELPTRPDAMRSHRALTGLMVLAAHAGLDAELSRASKSLFRHVAAPFARRHDVRRHDPANDPFLIAVTFEALARLCDAVARMEEGRRSDESPTRSAVGSLLHHAGEAYFGDPLAPMSRWLGAYLRERCDVDWATDDLTIEAMSHGTPV